MFTKQHYELLAEFVGKQLANKQCTTEFVFRLADKLGEDNSKFEYNRFCDAVKKSRDTYMGIK